MPNRFVAWEFPKDDVYGQFWKKDDNGFVNFGVDGYGGFILGNEKSGVFCFHSSRDLERVNVTTVAGRKR